MGAVKMKILFQLNQILGSEALAGGEVRALSLIKHYAQDSDFEVYVEIPEISLNFFTGIENINIVLTGKTGVEKLISKTTIIPTAIAIGLTFGLRTIESFKNQKTYNNMHIVYSTGDFFCNVIPAWFYKLKNQKIKWVVCIHHIIGSYKGRSTNNFFRNVFSFLLQRVSFILLRGHVDKVFVVNKTIINQLSKLISQNIDLFEFIGNGMEIEENLMLIKGTEQTATIHNNNVCFFGRLSPTKGVFDLPEIFEKILKVYPDSKLELIGIYEESIMHKLKDAFREKHVLEKVNFYGYMPDKKEVYKKILESKVILFPSYEEGWGISVFEAMLCKKPVVTYDLPVFTEIFGHYLQTAPLGNTETFANIATSHLDKINNSETNEFVEECYKKVITYDWKDVFKKEKEQLKKLINQH